MTYLSLEDFLNRAIAHFEAQALIYTVLIVFVYFNAVRLSKREVYLGKIEADLANKKYLRHISSFTKENEGYVEKENFVKFLLEERRGVDRKEYEFFINSFIDNSEDVGVAFDYLSTLGKAHVLAAIKYAKSKNKKEGVPELEPNAMIGLFGSIASIIGLLQQNGIALSANSILSQFRVLENKEGSFESKIGKIVTEDDILEKAEILIGIDRADGRFLERIRVKCLKPYYDSIDDYDLDEVELEDIRGSTSYCVCANINMARKGNGGSFPSKEFKQLWKDFGCN